MLTELQKKAVEETIKEIETENLLEYQFLFELAGRLRGTEPQLRASDRRAARRLMPVAMELARRVREESLGGNFIEWDDEEAIELEFEKAWTSRRLPKSTDLFERAVALSEQNFLNLPESTNRWVSRVANLAFCLSEMLPDTPMLIPVNDKTAAMLGTSLRTLSLAVQEIIRERLVTVLEKTDQALPMRRARRLKFNPKHPWVANDIDQARKWLRETLKAQRPPEP